MAENEEKSLVKTKGIQTLLNSLQMLLSQVNGVEKQLNKVEEALEETKRKIQLNAQNNDQQFQQISQQMQSMNQKEDDGQQQQETSCVSTPVTSETSNAILMEARKVGEEVMLTLAEVDNDFLYSYFFSHQQNQTTILPGLLFTWKVNAIAFRMQQATFECESNEFHLPGHPLTLLAKLTCIKDVIHYSIRFQRTDNGKKVVIVPGVVCVLKDNNQKRHRVRAHHQLFKTKMQDGVFYYRDSLAPKSSLEDSDYNRNDSVEIFLLVEDTFSMFNMASTDGRIEQRVDNYTHRVQLAKDGYLEFHSSPYFSPFDGGYRVQLRLWMNQELLKLQVIFLAGRNDGQLQLIFVHRMMVELVKQQGQGESFKKSAFYSTRNGPDYTMHLVSHVDIQRDGFLLNDTFHYRVTIEKQ